MQTVTRSISNLNQEHQLLQPGASATSQDVKMVSLFVLVVLATLASASPYFPARNRGYGYMDYPSMSKDLVGNVIFIISIMYQLPFIGD